MHTLKQFCCFRELLRKAHYRDQTLSHVKWSVEEWLKANDMPPGSVAIVQI